MPSKTGDTIRKRRTEANLSLRDVANKIGITHVQLGLIERGRSPVQQKYLADLARVIPGLDLDELQELTAKEVPLQLQLKSAPPAYQTLGVLLARRIEKQDLKARDMAELMEILGR